MNGFLALPHHMPQGARLLWDSADAIWRWAGDTATDFNFYTKRALLAGVYAATTLYWLDDRSPDSVDTQSFLDRRLRDVMSIPKATERVRDWAARLPDPFLLFGAVLMPRGLGALCAPVNGVFTRDALNWPTNVALVIVSGPGRR